MKRSSVLGLAGPFLLVVAVVALGLSLRHQGREANEALWRLNPLAVAAAFVAALGGLLASMRAWKSLLAGLGSPVSQRQATHIFFVGQLGKYIPGSVFAVGGQMHLAGAHSVPRSRVATSWLIFMGVLVSTGLLCAAVALPLTSPQALDDFGYVLLALPIGLLCLSPPVLNRVLSFILATLRRAPMERALSWTTIGAACGWALLMWALYALHLVLLVEPHGPSGAQHLPLLALGGFGLAWSVGLLVFVAPAGVGVREAVLIAVLTPVLTTPEATAVAIVSRLLLTLGDATLGGIGVLVRPRPPGKAQPGSPSIVPYPRT